MSFSTLLRAQVGSMRIAAMRLSREVPDTKAAMASGALSLSDAEKQTGLVRSTAAAIVEQESESNEISEIPIMG